MRAALAAHRRGRRADAHRPVVREDGRHGEGGPRGGGEGRDAVRPRALDHDLQPLAREHPGLVHLAPALVGPPDPGVVRRRRQRLRGPHVEEAKRAREGRGQDDHARARDPDVLDTWFSSALVPFTSLGWPDEDAVERERRFYLPSSRAGHRLRHHLLLGRAHDHDDAALHRQGAVPRRLHQRHRARRRGPEDVEVEGQHARSARPDRRHRASTRCWRNPRRACCWPSTRRRADQAHQARLSRTASRPSAPTRCASPSPRSRASRARSTSTSSAARATATSATSCGTRRASC